MKYFVVMIDYGTDVSKVHGMEAVIRPEHTRRQIIEQVRDVLDSGDLSLVHVKFIDGNFCEDVTEEFVHCAMWGDHVTEPHARDERKHERA